LVEEFRERFEHIFDEVLGFLPPPCNNLTVQNELRQMYFDRLNPLTCKVGYLQSDVL